MNYNDRLNLNINSNKKIISIDFLEKQDYIKTLQNEEYSFGASLNEVISIESVNSGICLDFCSILDISKKLYSQLNEVSKNNSIFNFKQNSLTSYFYSIVEVEASKEKIELLYLFKFISEPVLMPRNEWALSINNSNYDCCIINYGLNLEEKVGNIDFSILEKIESSCVYPLCFIETKSFVWIHLLNSSTNLKTYKKLNLNIENGLIYNQFLGFPVQLNFYNSNIEKFNKEVEFEEYFSISKLKKNKRFFFPQLCKDLPTSLNFESTSFKKFLTSCVFNVFLSQKLLYSENCEIKKNIKLLATCFYF